MLNALAEQIALGLSAGGLYALLALGLTLIYEVSGIVNFAQGALATVGAYLVWSLRNDAGLASLPGAAIGALLIGVLQSLLGSYLSLQWRDSLVFALLLATLLVRPAGLFGVAGQRRGWERCGRRGSRRR